MLLVSAAQQSESAIYIHIYLLFFGFPFHLGHHRAVTKSTILQQKLIFKKFQKMFTLKKEKDLHLLLLCAVFC